MSARLPCSNNMFIIRLVLILNQLLEQTFQRRKFKSMAKLSLSKFGIQLDKRNSNHLVLHSTEELTAVHFASISQTQLVSMPLITGRPASLKMQDPMIQKHSHSCSLEIKSIERVRERLLHKKHRRGAKKIMICFISKPQLRKV